MAENFSNSAYPASGWDAPSVGPVTEHATIGSSIVIKGNVSGQEPRFIDGTVEGSIHFPDHRVTVGRSSKITANIQAREVVVMGSVKGNLRCGDLLDVRAESYIQGEIIARRIRIDDGAMLKGSVEIQKPDKSAQEPRRVETAPAKAESVTPAAAEPAVAEPESAKSQPSKAQVLASAVARRVPGSSVLWKPAR